MYQLCRTTDRLLELVAISWGEETKRLAPFKAEKAKEEIEHLLGLTFIEPAYSPWVCGIEMAKKEKRADILM